MNPYTLLYAFITVARIDMEMAAITRTENEVSIPICVEIVQLYVSRLTAFIETQPVTATGNIILLVLI